MNERPVQTDQKGATTLVQKYRGAAGPQPFAQGGSLDHLVRKEIAQDRDYRVGVSSVGVISRRRGETVITDVKTFRLIIIESQLLFARALGQVLSSDSSIYVTSILRSVEDLPANSSQKADLVLVDIDEYCLDIAGLLASCKQRVPDTHVCALSSFVRPELMQRCLAAGAEGFIIKDTSVSELISAIKVLAGGSPYVDPRVAGGVLRRRAMNQEVSLNESVEP